MTQDSPDSIESLIDEQLCAYQSLLDSGAVLNDDSLPRSRVPEAYRPEFDELRSCLDLLHTSRALVGHIPKGDAPALAPGSFYIPSHIGRFPVSGQLGSGGCGIVYRGIDPVMKRDVAIKIPRPELLVCPELISRFANEAAAASQLEHRNIVPVFESQSDGIVPYIVMPYIAGHTLAQWLLSVPDVSPRQAAEIIHQLAEALAHSHERGVLHRDIKPGNVLLAPRESSQAPGELPFVPKLTDFGLAKCADVQPPETRTGALLGTTNYMAPEQARGHRREITALTDVYGLGAVLYELLAGVPPFRGGNDLETIQLILHQEAPAPRIKRPEIPRDLEIICLKCLEKRPQNRYSSARALADDLGRYLRGEPIHAQPFSLTARFAKWCRRRPAGAATLLAGVLGLIVLVGLSLWYNSRLTTLLQVAEHERQTAKEQELLAKRRAYVADMHNATIAWDHADVEQTLKLLERYRPQPAEPDLRDFVWWYLWREYHEASRVLGTHEGFASAVAITRAGDLAASGGSDSLIKLWELPSGKQVGELRGHDKDDVTSLDFSPAGDRLVSSGNDGTVRVWDVKAGRELICRREHQSPVSRALYSPQGDLIASGGDDQLVRLWNPETGEPAGVLEGHTDKLRCLAFHPTERTLASGSRDGVIRLWNLDELRSDARHEAGMISMPSSEIGIRALAFEPNGNSLIVGTNDAQLVLFSLEQERFGEKVADQRLPRNPYAIVWPSHGFPVIALGNSEISIADPAGVQLGNMRLRGHRDVAVSVAIAADEMSLVSASRDGTVRFWPQYQSRPGINIDQAKGTAWKNRTGHYRLQWVGPYLVSDFQQEDLTVFRMPERKLVCTIPKSNEERFVLSAQGTFTLLYKGEGQTTCLRTETGELLWTRQLAPFTQNEIEFQLLDTDDSERYGIAACTRELVVFSLQDGTILHRLLHPRTVFQSNFLNRNGEPLTALSTSYDGVLRFWDVQTGKLLKDVHSHSYPMILATLSSNQRFLAINGSDQKAHVLRTSDFSQAAIFHFESRPEQIAFLPDSDILAVRSNERSDFDVRQRIGHVPSHISLMNLREESNLLTVHTYVDGEFAVSPDGRQLAIFRPGWIEIMNGTPVP